MIAGVERPSACGPALILVPLGSLRTASGCLTLSLLAERGRELHRDVDDCVSSFASASSGRFRVSQAGSAVA